MKHLAGWLLVSAMAWAGEPKPDCLSAYGMSACGYHCIGEYSQVKCAVTPQGVCISGSCQVLCFDPPAHVISLWGEKLPRPTCVREKDRLACGYHCKAQGAEVACATTPAGVCTADYGMVRCFDPPVSVYAVHGREVPKPSCMAQDGQIACGYHCVAAAGRLQCASTPQGICTDMNGVPTCFDPPADVLCAVGKNIDRATCKTGLGKVVCGYHCTLGFGELECARNPRGFCKVEGSGVKCFDPPITAQPGGKGTDACLQLLGLSGVSPHSP